RTRRRPCFQRRWWPRGHHPGICGRRHAPVWLQPVGRGDRRIPLRRYPAYLLGHQCPAGTGVGTQKHAGRLGRRVCRVAQGHERPRRGAGRGRRADARPRGGQKGGSMKAFLLAAGVGSRLRPITDTIPKCMVPIGGQPMIDIWLDAFERAGVDEVLVNLHHLSGVVRRPLPARDGAPTVRTFFEPELLGSAGTLIANRAWVSGEEMFLACYADNLTDFDLSSLIQTHREHSAIATLTVFHSERPSAGGVVELDEGGTVV